MKFSYPPAFVVVPLLFLLLYFQVFTADFAYLDEAHQLWYNRDDTNFRMFATQGRWLSGLLFQKVFSAIDTIHQLIYLRLFSLFGWIATTLLWWQCFSKWCHQLSLPVSFAWLVNLFVICCIPVAVYIGWASCLEVFSGVAAALVSGHLLFQQVYNQKTKIQIPFWKIICILLFGVVALFFYQTAFGVFLLPFFLQYVFRKQWRPDRTVIIGLCFYLVTYIIYYGLFKYTLQQSGVEASTRTGISFNFSNKLSFFFAEPLAQSFSVNYLFSPRSIVSQVLYPLLFGFWIVTVFVRQKRAALSTKLGYIFGVLALLLLIYLPLIIAKENFASYRTLFALNIAVVILLADASLSLIRTQKRVRFFTITASLILVVLAFYNFNMQYINPLQKEYAALKNVVFERYKPGVHKVYFMRPEKNLFQEQGIRTYKDELGVPSTYRDWVPEPLLKQLVFEKTGDRALAAALPVNQFENKASLDSLHLTFSPADLVIDMNAVYKNAMQKNR